MSTGTPLKIVLIVTSGGTARNFVTPVAAFFARAGCEVSVIADSVTNIPPHDRVPHVSYIDVPMVRDPSPGRDLHSLWSLYRQLLALRPDAILYATPKASLLGSIASTAARIPSRTYQLWGLRLETTKGTRRTLLLALERLAAALSTQVLPNSPSLRRAALQLGIGSPDKTTVLGSGSSHGIDLCLFSATQDAGPLDRRTAAFLNASQGGPIVGFVGRLHADKGLSTLINAFALIQASDQPARLLIVGADEGFAAETAHLNLTNASNVHFVGHVSDVRPYYKQMDVFVLPSRREGFPNVVLEAAAMGVPAVVTNGTGVVDSVVDGETGLVVEVDNSQQLAAAIGQLLEDEDLRHRLGAQARARAHEAFSKDVVLQKLLNSVRQDVSKRTIRKQTDWFRR